jgi:hypothetical protein
LYLVAELSAHNLELLCCSCTRNFERLNCDSPIRHWRLIVAPNLINQVADSWIGSQLDASRIEGGGPLPTLHVTARCTRSMSVQQPSPAQAARSIRREVRLSYSRGGQRVDSNLCPLWKRLCEKLLYRHVESLS